MLQSRPVKKDRAHWGLPADKFILFVAGTTNRLDFMRYPAHPLWEMARRIPRGIVLFLDKPEGSQSYIRLSLAEYNAGQEDRHKVNPSRLCFLPWMHDKGDFWELLEAVGHEGGRGATVCPFGSMSLHTGAGDAFVMCVPHFTCSYPAGTMQQRVASEIVTAAGFQSQCVGATLDETVEKVVTYAHNGVLQDWMIETMKQNREEKVGFYDVMRGPRFLAYAVERAYAQKAAVASGDREKIEDFTIPLEAGAMDALGPDVDVSGKSQIKLLIDAGMPVELLEVTAGMLAAMEMQGCTLLKHEGSGAFTIAILARFDREETAAVIKISKTGVFPAQMHNTPLFREAKCQGEWHNAMRKHRFVGLIPKPLAVLEGEVFFGHSLPNAEGHVVPFLICEYIPNSFSDVAKRHRENWQASRLLEDSFRVDVLQPVSLGLFWLQHNDRMMVIARDLKPDNVRFRDDGTMAVVDLGSSATFSVAGKNFGPRRLVSIVERQPTEVHPGGQRRGSGLLKGQSRLGQKYVGIPYSAVENFCKRVGDRGLAVIGGTTRAFEESDKDGKLKQQERQGRLTHQRVLPRFNAKVGCWRDSFAFFRMVLHDLTRQDRESIVDWSTKADEAARQGVDGIKKMLLGAGRGGPPQQPQAFERLADFLHRGLCPRNVCINGHQTERMGIMGAVTHAFTTLAILTPDQERQFISPRGLPFPHGPVTKNWPAGFLASMSAAERNKVEKAVIPELSYAKQAGMDGGVLALQDVPGNALLGVYVGSKVRNHNCGTVYDNPEFPSRFKVTGQGALKICTQIGETKFTCDAQGDLERDFQWCLVINNSGPFMNAAESQKSANCSVDRHSAWYDEETGLIWMLVWSRPAGIKKGEYCLWFYNYKAGAGKLWHFDDKLCCDS